MKKLLLIIIFLILSVVVYTEIYNIVNIQHKGIWRVIWTDSGKSIKILNLPDVRQSTGYTCGVSSLQSILMYWGKEYREDMLSQMASSHSEYGTPPENIVSVAKNLGLQAEIKQECTISEIEKWIEAGIPVIVDIQAWKDKDNTLCWKDCWEDGHYVVAIGYDEKNIYFEDASILGAIGYIPKEEFLDRWHDYEGKGPFDAKTSKITKNLAIIIQGNQPVVQEFIQNIK